MRAVARAGSAVPRPTLNHCHARNSGRRRPVGRRRQGEGHRHARRACRRCRALSGWQQCRPHDRARRADVEAPSDAVGDPASRQAVCDRQRGGDRPEGADRRARRVAAPSRGHALPADLGQRAPDHALPPDARPRRRGQAGQAGDRYHPPRDRAVLCRQGRPVGHPHAGPAGREDPQEEDPGRARAQAPQPAPVRQGPRSTCRR
jgi:hypothetical protein